AVVLEVEVEDVVVGAEQQEFVALAVAQVSLRLQAGAVAQLPRPVRHQVALYHFHGGNHESGHDAAMLTLSLQDVPVQGELLPLAAPVGAEADLLRGPAVGKRRAIGSVAMVPLACLTPDTPMQVAVRGRTVPETGAALVVARLRHHEAAPGLGGMPRDDVDNAVDRIGAPKRGAWPADHFDALDILEQRALHFPEHAGEQRRVE